MPRSRVIWPEFFTDFKLGKVSRDARLLFAALWCYADDAGLHPCDPGDLKAEAFPHDKDIDYWAVGGMLIELAGADYRVIPYVAGGQVYLAVRNFLRRQSTKYPSKAVNPLPPFIREAREDKASGRSVYSYSVDEDALEDYLGSEVEAAKAAMWGTCSPQLTLSGVGNIRKANVRDMFPRSGEERYNQNIVTIPSSTVQAATPPGPTPTLFVPRQKSRTPCYLKPLTFTMTRRRLEALVGPLSDRVADAVRERLAHQCSLSPYCHLSPERERLCREALDAALASLATVPGLTQPDIAARLYSALGEALYAMKPRFVEADARAVRSREDQAVQGEE